MTFPSLTRSFVSHPPSTPRLSPSPGLPPSLTEQESSKVLQDRPTSVFFPFCVLGAQVPLLIYLVVGLLFLGTADLNVGHLTSSDALTAHSTFADALARVNDTLSEGDDVAINNLSYIYFLFGAPRRAPPPRAPLLSAAPERSS